MDHVEDVLREHSAELIDLLRGDTGLTPSQARDFFQLAGPALVESWRWWSHSNGRSPAHARPAAREILALMPGNSLATATGLEPARAWQGLRTMVPAVVDFGAPRRRTPVRRVNAFP